MGGCSADTMHEPAPISSTIPDWSRETMAEANRVSRRLLAAIRRYQRHSGSSIFARLHRARAVLEHRIWSAVCSSDIPLNGKLGGGLLLPHPFGIVIHPAAEIGVNCLIFQGVTIGLVDASAPAPRIGGHVDIGAGAKILGDVSIGDHAKIGANAVVLKDVPPGATAVGIPARIIGGG